MANINLFIPILKQLEGGFCDNVNDPGGATNLGVTLSTFQQFYGQDKTVQDLINITDEQYINIVKTGYWDKCLADSINSQSIANIFVDFEYNSGGYAIIHIQKLLNLPSDGIVGQHTIDAINNSDAQTLFNSIKQNRLDFYKQIVISNPREIVFLVGWNNRVNSFNFQN